MDRNQSQNLVRNAPASVYPQVAALPSSNPKRPPTLPGMTPRTHRPRAVITLGVLMLLPALAACGGDPTPGPTSAPDHAAVTADVPTATWTPSPVDVLAQLPPAAKERTTQGAEAFVRHYIDSLNALGQNPQTGQITQLCRPKVEACANPERAISDMAQSRTRFEAPVYDLRAIGSVAIDPEDLTGVFVETKTDARPRSLLNENRSTKTSYPSQGPDYSGFTVVWAEGRWYINGQNDITATTRSP